MTKARWYGVLAFLAASGAMPGQEAAWMNLVNGKDLSGWQVRGLGIWSVLDGGILVGQCDPDKPCLPQSWLYTEKEFGENFDLSLDYWLRVGGNSGVSIGDRQRAKFAVDPKTGWPTPARTAYEVNIDNGTPRDFDISGSIYKLAQAKPGVQRRTDWNSLFIEVRSNLIRVRLNGVLVAQHPGLPDKPKSGPIGLQLHAPTDVVMFRNLRVREVK